MEENLATDTTLEYVILDKMSADRKYEGVLRSEIFTDTGTWVWTPEVNGK